jgi:hypothetical protein
MVEKLLLLLCYTVIQLSFKGSQKLVGGGGQEAVASLFPPVSATGSINQWGALISGFQEDKQSQLNCGYKNIWNTFSRFKPLNNIAQRVTVCLLYKAYLWTDNLI